MNNNKKKMQCWLFQFLVKIEPQKKKKGGKS